MAAVVAVAQSLSRVQPMDCSTPRAPVLHCLPEFAQIHVHWCSNAISPSHSLLPLSPFASNLSWHQSFPMRRLFASGGRSIGSLSTASFLPMNIQDWFPLGLACLISLESKGLPGVFYNTAIWKHQCFSTQLSLWSNFHICTWILEKPKLWL